MLSLRIGPVNGAGASATGGGRGTYGVCERRESKTMQKGDTGGPFGPSQMKSSHLAWVALVVVGLIFGYNWVVMKSALEYADPATFAAMRVFFGAVFLFLLLVVLRRPLRLVNWPLTLLVGLFGMTGFTGLTFWALESGGAGKTSVLVYTMPIWLLIMSRVVLGERVRGRQWLYVSVALVGLVFVISPWDVQGTVVGNLMAVGAGVCSAASSVVVKILCRDRRVDLLSLNAWQMLFGSVPLVVIAFLTADSGPQWTGWFVVTLLYNVILGSSVALLLWFYALRQLPAGTAGLGRLIAPVIGVVASWLQLGEHPDRYEIIGMVLIMAGLTALAVQQFVTERRTARAQAQPAFLADQPPAVLADEPVGD
jgi:drug/metabolite transporter (DMT)-like permease